MNSQRRLLGSASCAAIVALVLVCVGMIATVTPAQAGVTVAVLKGSVVDSAGVTVPDIQVRVMESVFGPDTLLQTTQVGADGKFEIVVFPDNENYEIYLVFEWLVAITALPGKFFTMVDIRTIEANPNVSNPFDILDEACSHTAAQADESGRFNCGAIAMPDALNAARASYANLFKLIRQSFAFYQNRKGNVNWVVDYLTRVRIHTDSVVSFEINTTLNIADVDINGVNAGPGQGFQSDIYHETAHLVHDESYTNGLPFPDGATNNSHTSNSEKTPGFAITEGWASFVQDATDRLPSHAGDMKVRAGVADANRTNWLGGSRHDQDGQFERMNGARGLHGANFENGEVVEGALSAAFAAIRADASLGSADNFTDLFRVVIDDDPAGVRGVAKGLAADYGANTAKTKRVYELMQRHGIFFTRGRFSVVEFQEGAPPNTAAAATAGNFAVISEFPFARGELTALTERLGNLNLGVRSRIPASKVAVAYKTADDANYTQPTTFVNYTADVAITGAAVTPVKLDTRAFAGQGPMGEGDWALLVRTTNEDGFPDNFDPDWGRDTNTLVDKDEKYLKRVGAWFDLDRNPQTLEAKQGKIVVDNKAPVVVPNSFKPQ